MSNEFQTEVNALFDVTAYIEDKELREALERAIKSTASSISWDRKRKAEEKAANDAGLCRFNEAWQGRCNEESVNEAKTLCKKHLGMKCSAKNCNRHATQTCAATYAFVCGAPVCKNHTRCDRGRHW